MLDPPLKIRLYLPLLCLHCHEDNNGIFVIVLNDSFIIRIRDDIRHDSGRRTPRSPFTGSWRNLDPRRTGLGRETRDGGASLLRLYLHLATSLRFRRWWLLRKIVFFRKVKLGAVLNLVIKTPVLTGVEKQSVKNTLPSICANRCFAKACK